MKKQYKLYYNKAHTISIPFKEGMYVWSGVLNRTFIQRIDVCTCDDYCIARILSNILCKNEEGLDIQIEEVEV